MSSDRDVAEVDDTELLPDERAAIEERLEELEDTDRRLSTAEVADELGIDIE